MNKNKHLFVVSLCVIFAVCFYFMNTTYDRLSRYPYQDKEQREIIDAHLSDEEIEYIIEYSIAPNLFISFIDAPRFNIYHAAQYKELSRLRWEETPSNIVKMVEDTYEYLEPSELHELLYHYDYNELLFVLKNEDPYNPESVFSRKAGSMTVYLDDNTTVGNRVPDHLEHLTNVIGADKTNIYVEEVVNDSLIKVCAVFEDHFETSQCGGLIVTKGYVPYEEQVNLFNEANSDVTKMPYPGHDEHQLGLCVDISMEGLSDAEFIKTDEFKWLAENAYKYGLIQTYTESTKQDTNKPVELTHFRYVGSIAQTLKNENISLKQYNEK